MLLNVETIQITLFVLHLPARETIYISLVQMGNIVLQVFLFVMVTLIAKMNLGCYLLIIVKCVLFKLHKLFFPDLICNFNACQNNLNTDTLDNPYIFR